MNGSEIKAFLERHQLTVDQFAEIIGVTPAGIYHWVQGRRLMSLTVARLCRLFDRRPELLKEFAA
jgi:DNA-binding transcriptional regulator YiaG